MSNEEVNYNEDKEFFGGNSTLGESRDLRSSRSLVKKDSLRLSRTSSIKFTGIH